MPIGFRKAQKACSGKGLVYLVRPQIALEPIDRALHHVIPCEGVGVRRPVRLRRCVPETLHRNRSDMINGAPVIQQARKSGLFHWGPTISRKKCGHRATGLVVYFFTFLVPSQGESPMSLFLLIIDSDLSSGGSLFVPCFPPPGYLTAPTEGFAWVAVFRVIRMGAFPTSAIKLLWTSENLLNQQRERRPRK